MSYKKQLLMVVIAGLIFSLKSIEPQITDELVKSIKYYNLWYEDAMSFMPLNSEVRRRCKFSNTSNSCYQLAAIFHKVNEIAFIAKELPKIKQDIIFYSDNPSNPLNRAKLKALIDQKTEYEKIIKTDPNCLFRDFPNVDSPKDTQLFEEVIDDLITCNSCKESALFMSGGERVKELNDIERALNNARAGTRFIDYHK